MRTRPARNGILVILCLQVAEYIAKAIFVYKPAVGLLGGHCSSSLCAREESWSSRVGLDVVKCAQLYELNKIVR